MVVHSVPIRGPLGALITSEWVLVSRVCRPWTALVEATTVAEALAAVPLTGVGQMVEDDDMPVVPDSWSLLL